MTRERFFKICDSCDQKYAHQLYLTERREHRGLDNIIELSGSSWCNGGLLGMTIYTPLKGRQAFCEKPYQKANELIDKAMTKYKRWLIQWKIDKGVENGPKGGWTGFERD